MEQELQDHKYSSKFNFVADFIFGIILSLTIGATLFGGVIILFAPLMIAPMKGSGDFLIIIIALFVFLFSMILIFIGKNWFLGRIAGFLTAPIIVFILGFSWPYIVENRAMQTRYDDKKSTDSLIAEIMEAIPSITLSTHHRTIANEYNKTFAINERSNARLWLESNAPLSNSIAFNIAYIVLSKGGATQWREAMDIIWALPPDRHVVAITSSGQIYNNRNLTAEDTIKFLHMVKRVPLPALDRYVDQFWPYPAGKPLKGRLVTALQERIEATTSQEDADRITTFLNTAVLPVQD
jgi:hypothetical protein